MAPRAPVDARAGALMVLLCFIWALQQIAIKAAAPDAPAVLQIGLRSALSALLVALLMWRTGQRPDWHGNGRAGALVGLLFGAEFWLLGEALHLTTASHAVVFLYTAPIFAAMGLHKLVPGERLHTVQWLGIALAFGGIAVAFARAPTAGGATSWTGDLLALAAGAAWGATTVAVRATGLSNAPATETLLYQLLGATVLLLAVAVLTGQTQMRATPLALASIAFQAIVVSFASYLAWFWLLRRYQAATLGVFSFLTPPLGVALGAVLLDEPLEAAFIQGALLVLAGVVVVSGYPAYARRKSR